MDIITEAKNNVITRLLGLGLKIDMEMLSMNPSLTMEFVEAHPGWKWNMQRLSRNPSLTVKFLKAHPWWEYDTCWLPHTNLLVLDFASCAPCKKRCTEELSSNLSLTLDSIEAHIDSDWDTKYLSRNGFIVDVERGILRLAKKHMAAYRIFDWHRRVTKLDPTFKRARKYMEKQFRNMLS